MLTLVEIPSKLSHMWVKLAHSADLQIIILGMTLGQLICSHSPFQARTSMQRGLAPVLHVYLAEVGSDLNPSATSSRAKMTGVGQVAATLSSPIKKRKHFFCWTSAPCASLMRTDKMIAAPCSVHGSCPACLSWDALGCGHNK